MIMNNLSNIKFSVAINHHPISKQSSLKYLGIIYLGTLARNCDSWECSSYGSNMVSLKGKT